MTQVKNTPLHQKHIVLGARMTEFAGYSMPMSYAGLTAEHKAVRNSVGVFDVSHMGEFIVRGPDALELVQKITSNNAARLMPGQAQYSCMPNNDGGIVDDLIVYRLAVNMESSSDPAFMLVVNASNIQKDLDWVNANNTFDASVVDISDDTALIAVQGPRTTKLIQPLTDVALDDIAFYHFARGRFADVDNVIISATGYTGSGGFELYMHKEHAVQIWDAIFAQSVNFEVLPAGLGARDTLRLEMGYCLYGNDIDDTTSPLEAGLGWITKTKKGQFNSVKIFQVQRAEGVHVKLVGFEVLDRRVPRQGYEIVNADGTKIGRVTSGTMSPCLQRPIGLGYVEIAYTAPGSTIFISTGKKNLEATVTKPPFYKKPAAD